MKLIIDIGNSFAKIAVFKGDNIILLKTTGINCHRNVEEIIIENNISSAIISSVSHNAEKIKQVLLSAKINFIELHHNTLVPFVNRYDSPATLGKDRIAIAAAAVSMYPDNNVLVIDAGTCITYDFVNKNGEYIGGAISPGLYLRLKALNTFTSRLPLLEMPPPEMDIDLLGRNTNDSILSGVFCAAQSEIQAIISRYQQQYSPLITVISGGDYKYFEKLLKSNIFATPNVVVLGLKKILDFNENRKD